MFAELLQSPYFALFVIVTLGFLLGRIKVKGVSLDISAVIFVALAFGHFGVIIPKEFGTLGLVLFIFTIGIQAGPGFFGSFKTKGKNLIILTAIIIVSATLAAVGMKYLFHLDTASVAGLLAGALTSSPGLAVAIDTTASPLASIAYGVAYPFGVIGVILFIKLLPKILRRDLQKEADMLEKQRSDKYPELKTCMFHPTNASIHGHTLAQLNLRATTGAVISRIQTGGNIIMPTADYAIKPGDTLQAVGTEDALNQMAMLIGEREEGELPLAQQQGVASVLVSRKDLVGKNLGSINMQQNFGCTVTRVRRSGVDITPTPDLSLKFGDKLTIVGEADGIKNVSALMGNNGKVLSDTDFLPISLGIVIGVLVGKISITFPGGMVFSLGLTGGVLLTALILSAIGKTGPILWTLSSSANNLLRQFGLLLFLSEVGTSAGQTLVESFMANGWAMIVAGAVITLVPLIVATLVGLLCFKVSTLDLLGTLAGGMTSTPGLAAADSMADSNVPGITYATVYPIAMVLLILCIQLIATVFV